MNVLVLGSGGREHAISWKIKQSALLNKLYIAPGNAGTKFLATNVSISLDNFEALKKFVLENSINMIIVGGETLLVKGIQNFFKNDEQLKHILFIGPSKQAAKLEGSKEYAKNFMQKYNIPKLNIKVYFG